MARKKDFESMCSNWSVLQKHINHLTQDELTLFMKLEKENRNRVNILTRLYSRYSKIRREKEMKKLMS